MLTCRKCSYTWYMRTGTPPKRCPNCGSLYWNSVPRRECPECSSCPNCNPGKAKATATPEPVPRRHRMTEAETEALLDDMEKSARGEN